MNKKIVITLIVVSAMLSITFVFLYNRLVRAEMAVKEAKAQIAVACQRKLDLIPNLVETVKGYAKHERETLAAVTEARNKAQKILQDVVTEDSLSKNQLAKLDASQGQLSGALKSLFALAENYPNLKASSNFLVLQDQLEGAENRISLARQRYNYSVRLYSTKVATFPGNIVARIFGFQIIDDYFQASKEAVAVNF